LTKKDDTRLGLFEVPTADYTRLIVVMTLLPLCLIFEDKSNRKVNVFC
jgi:hypothetical protein